MAPFPSFRSAPQRIADVQGARVHEFTLPAGSDEAVIRSFGEEWTKFHRFSAEDLRVAGEELFDLWPATLDARSTRMLDLGCGSGRWTRFLADRVGHVDAVDPSDAVLKAAEANADLPHVRWSKAHGEELPFDDAVFDVTLCIGVLHHVRDPRRVLAEVWRTLRPGGLFYFYLYYAMEQRSALYRLLHRMSELLRGLVHRLPGVVKRPLCDVLALLIYLPLVSLARMLKALGVAWWKRMPLAYYHNKSFRLMRNDALDRFGTAYERRSTRAEIEALLQGAGFTDVRFSTQPPYWHGTVRKSEMHRTT